MKNKAKALVLSAALLSSTANAIDLVSANDIRQ